MTRPLAWIPPNGVNLLGPLPDSIEVVAIPDDPASDPRLGEVVFLVPPFRMDFSPLFDQMTSLKVVQTVSAGVDSIIDSIPAHLTLCSARGAHGVPVAEWTISAILAGQQELAFFRDEQVAHRWSRRPTTRLLGSTVTFLGYGAIAKAAEERLAGFGVTVERIARRPREGVAGIDELEAILSRTDVLVVLLPLTDETRGLLDARLLGLLPDGALVVNAARGAIIDTTALLAELTAGRLRAVLDVTDPEPLPEDHPLWSAPGVLITPHMAGITREGQSEVFRVITEQLTRFALGQPLENVVEAGY